MEGIFVNFALEGSSAASTVMRKTRRETIRDASTPWKQPPMRLGSLPQQKSAKKPRNSARTYPGLSTPETPSNAVEMEVEIDDIMDGWDTPHNMYTGQQIFGDVSKL